MFADYLCHDAFQIITRMLLIYGPDYEYQP